MDGTRGFDRVSAAGDGPGTRLVRPGGEEADEAEQVVAGADDAYHARALQPEILAEDLRFLLVKLPDLHLDLG